MTAAVARPEPAPKPRVLVAEDEFLVYLVLEEDLRARGFEVVGPFTTVGEIHAAVRRERIDLALLDINIGGEMIYPVADELIARNTPFLFLSGYVSAAVPERYRAIARLDKPCDPGKLARALDRLMETAG